MEIIIKRNGEESKFDSSKIKNAITKANAEVDPVHQLNAAQIKAITENVANQVLAAPYSVSVEQIQDLVEIGIMEMRGYEVAQKYVRYRYTRELARKANTTDDAIFSLINQTNEEIKQENSNKNPSINSTQRDYMAGEVSKDLTRRVLLPEDIVKAHDDGIIHFHDSDYFAQREHNCFGSKIEFVTSKGIKKFGDCTNGEELLVLTKDGTWRNATVKNYGKKEMQLVTLTSGKTEKIIKCTKDHRWVLKDGTITTNLSIGDRLWLLREIQNEPPVNPDAWCLGFIIGDGTDIVSSKKSGVKVRLCGNKTKYKDIFTKAGYTVNQKFANGDIVMTNYNNICKSDFLKLHGWNYMSFSDKVSLFNGYYAADGNNNCNRVATANEDILNMILDISALAGYHITSYTKTTNSTNFKKNRTLYYVYFMKKQNDNRNWIVKDIKIDNHGAVYDAWCVEEPETHTFTLAGGIVTGNCDLIDLEDMLQNGTVISETKIDTPRSFYTACNVTTQIVAQVASNQFGGQTFTLSHLAPFVDVSRQKLRKEIRKERELMGDLLDENIINKVAEMRLKDEIKRGVQTIQYQLVTLMTTNGQTPFVSVCMYLDEVPEGQLRDDLALIIEEVLKQRIEGIKNEKGVWVTPAFPKLLYVLDEDNVMPDSKYWDLTVLAAKCTAKRMVPDYISAKVMKELKNGNVYPCMGCRSFLTVEDNQRNPDGSYKFYGRFNQGVVTINLVDVACSSNGDMDLFWKILDERLELCHRALRCRHERLLGTPSDVAPILWQHGALARMKKGEKIDKLLFDGYSTISFGYAGLYEMCMRMTGKSHTDPETKPFALAVMQRLNDKCNEWKAAENISYSVYGTPMESTTYKFAKCLQKRFGIIEGVTDKNYITNSYHVHVTEKIDAFSKLRFESEFQKLSPGGAISYVEVPDLQDNIEAVIEVMKFIYDNIMYAELNTKSDYCECCGYDGEIIITEDEKTDKLVWECPNCGNRNQDKMSVARRTCGYIGSQFWNQGRTQEIKDRVLHL